MQNKNKNKKKKKTKKKNKKKKKRKKEEEQYFKLEGSLRDRSVGGIIFLATKNEGKWPVSSSKRTVCSRCTRITELDRERGWSINLDIAICAGGNLIDRI